MTTDELRAELRRLLSEQSSGLVTAMVNTNRPIEQRLDEVNEHLKELNGKVYAHALALAKGGERMDGLRADINDLKGDRRSGQPRREQDREAEKGEDRRITMRDLYIVMGTVGFIVAVLKFFGKL